jgi:triacylglycerol esterase/lipase EstA (alpha/beta hydrolase family)
MMIAFLSLKQGRLAVTSTKIIVLGFISLVVVGCATPVGINPVDIQSGYQLNTRSVLSSGQPSEASKTVLRRNGLIDRFDREPAAVLAELHADLESTGDEDRLFALAELSLLHGQNTGGRAYFLASSVYAWALLFPDDDGGVQLKASDPRYRLAYDLYNNGLARGLAASPDDEQDEVEVRLQSGKYKLPFGTLQVTMDESGVLWGGYRLERFVSTTSMAVRGLRNRYRTPGLGASLAASIAQGPASSKFVGSKRIGPRTKVPVTALLRLEHARADLAGKEVQGRLEVYAADQISIVAIDGRQQPLESDPTAALAYQLDDNPLYTLEFANFLKGGIFAGTLPKDRAHDGLFTLQPYKSGKIPVVLVHGTGSSPVRWAELVNELEGDPRIRENFQIWAFFYDSGNPIPYSAGQLREALTNAVHEFDPGGTDPALQRMVVIGHSQGGLLTKLTAIDGGTRFWNLVSDKPFDKIHVDPETRAFLKRSLFFTPLPFVKRVIFIATPHHGAILAARQWITGLAARLVTLPQTMLTGFALVATSTGDERLAAKLRRPPTAIDNMNPNNPGLKLLSTLPVSSQVRAHSIIAVEGDGLPEEGDDGVVAYRSAHIDNVTSEKVVRCSHSCQGEPEAIEEVRRILLEHLATPDAPNL